jgi:hypothetical protein
MRLPASSCTATSRGLRHAAFRPAEVILGPLADCLCTILQATSGEYPFHALR